MQKRIKLDQVLRQRNADYPNAWKKVLQKIVPASPIFVLNNLGVIALIDQVLYLVIHNKYTKSWKCIKPMVDIYDYFLMPQCWRLNQHQHLLGNLQNYSVSFVIEFLQKLIQGSQQSLYLNIIDLSALGKLIISKHYVEYINGEHEWKYQFVLEKVYLPRLMTSGQEQEVEKQRIAKKWSVSLNKARSLSNNKVKEKSVILKRSSSVTKLQNVETKRLKTELSKQKIPQIADQKPQKGKLLLKQQRLRLQSRDHSIIQGSQIIEPLNKNNIDKRVEYSSSIFRRSKSKQKLLLSQHNNSRMKVPAQKQKPKLVLNQQKSLIPAERKKRVIDFQDTSRRHSQQIIDFIMRCTHNVLRSPTFYEAQHSQIKHFIVQLGQIYQQKFEQVKERRENEYEYYHSKKKFLRNKINLSKTIAKEIKLLTLKEQNIFSWFYQIIERYSKYFSNLTKEYIVNFEQYRDLMIKFIEELSLNFSKRRLSGVLLLQVGISLHNFHQYLLAVVNTVLSKIESSDSKLILVNVRANMSFQIVEKQYLQIFNSIWSSFEQILIKVLPKYLYLQAYQIQKTVEFATRISIILQRVKSIYEKNVGIFKTLQIKIILAGTFKKQKQAILLIKQLEKLKNKIEDQVNFRSEIMIDGIYLKMLTIKQLFLHDIDSKLHQIFDYFLSNYQKSVNELNLNLNAIVAVNADFLSDYKCREYKQNIDQNYKTIVGSLMLIIEHLLPLLKKQAIEVYLNTVYVFQEQITINFQNFDKKIDQYRKSSVQTIKILQLQNKANKQIYQKLNQNLKKLVNSFTTQKMILQQKNAIQKLQRQYEVYSIANNKLAISMKQNEMIYWEDDTYFIYQMKLLNKSLAFLEHRYYKVLAHTPVNELNISDFIASFQEFTSFIAQLEQNKLQKLFRPIYNLIEANVLLIQIFIYKNYQEAEIARMRQLGIEIENQKSNKILAIIKRYQSIDKKRLQKLEAIYREARLNEFNHMQEHNTHNFQFIKQRGEFNIEYIANIEQLRMALLNINQVKNQSLLNKLGLLNGLHNQVLMFNKLINLISNLNLNEQAKVHITEQINTAYQKLLKIDVSVDHIEILKNKLATMKSRYADILFNQKCVSFPRYCLYSIKELISLTSWQSKEQADRNIKILYEEIDDVKINQKHQIEFITISKDRLYFQKVLNVISKEPEQAKLVFGCIDGFMRNSLNHSQYASVQIKILFWLIYFTQQVELQMLSDMDSIQKLKERLQVVVSEIANQIRYDIKLHHKSYEIAQLSLFIAHIDKIKNINALTDFEWISTIRAYDRVKTTKIQQNDRVFQYGFEPKKPQNIDPAFQLQTAINYGYKQSECYYQQSAYILGKPFKTFKVLSEYGFQQNYLNLLSILKKYSYFLKIIVSEINFKRVNYLHKKIFEFTLKKEDIADSQKMRLPIFFQYPSQQNLPSCFPQKIHSFRTPEISYDINLIIYLQLNKIQSQIDKRGIDIDVLYRTLAYINKQKSVTLKEVLNFTSKLRQYLKNEELKHNIYKFCYTYFMVELEVETEELTLMLKKLIKTKNESKLDAFKKELKETFHEFIHNEQKRYLIVYGPTSIKTHLIRQLNVTSFCRRQQNHIRLYHVEGLQQFIQLQKQQTLKLNRFIIEDRFIWNIDPSELSNCQLLYVREIEQSNIELIFKSKISQLKIEGSYLVLWKMFTILHFIYVDVVEKMSLMGSMELIIRAFSKHINEFIKELDRNEQPSFQIAINKDLIRSFLMIVHEIYYYLTPTHLRKKLVQKIRENSFLQEYKNQELSSITCKGLNCEKIVNLIKKQKSIFSNLNYLQREMMVIKKYLSYGEIVIGIYNNSLEFKMVKGYVNRFQDNKINISFDERYMHLLQKFKYRDIVYIVDNVHLTDKRKLTYFKSFIEEISPLDMRYLLLSNSKQHQNILKRQITIYFSEIQIQQIFKYQSKSGIVDQIQQKSLHLWNNHLFESKQQYIEFLLKTTIKLPAQSYRKYYARLLVYNKMSLSSNSAKVIDEIEKYLSKQIEYTSYGLYLQPSTNQQLSQIQFNKKIENYLSNQNILNKIIAKEYYNKILPYTITDRLNIIIEQVSLLPLMIAHLSDKKVFRLKNHSFITQLVQIISTMYYEDKQFFVIVQQPLSSSEIWLQWLHLYLNNHDIVNFYPQLREFTDELVDKQEFVYRKRDLKIEIKGKIDDLIHNKMKIIVSIDEYNAKHYDIPSILREKVIFMNCKLDRENKSRIAALMIQKIIKQQKQPIKNIILPYRQLFIELINLELITLQQLQHFLLDIVEHVEVQIRKLQKRRYENKQNMKVLQSVIKIKQDLKQQVALEEKKVARSKIILDEVMKEIASYQQIEIPPQMQHQYYQHLVKVRNNFFNLQEKNVIDLKMDSHRQLYQVLKDIFFKECLTIYNDYVLLKVTSKCILQAIRDKNVSALLLKLLQNHNHPQLQDFILFKYFKYILNLVEQYQKFDFNELFIKKQVNKINYFYLLDISIELKNKYQVIMSQSQTIFVKLKLIDGFKDVFSNLYQIDFSQEELFGYHVFKRLTKIIRNYAIEQSQYPLQRLIIKQSQKFTKIQQKMDEFILEEAETNFQNFNREIFMLKKSLIIYDPYWQMQKLCEQLKIKVIYINSQKDLHTVYEYQNGMTVYCLRVSKARSWKENKRLINECLDIIQNKNSDLKQNVIEKMIISISSRAVLQQIDCKFPLINFDFSLISFLDMTKNQVRSKQCNFEDVRINYKEVKVKLIKEIEAIKKLSSAEIFLYIMTLQMLLQDYKQKHDEIFKVATTQLLAEQLHSKICQLYKTIIKLSKSNELPLNYTRRVFKRVSVKQLINKMFSFNNQKEREESLVKMIHSSRCDKISEEVEECLLDSRFIVVLFDNFNKKIMKDIIKLEQTGKYMIRTIVQMNEEQIDQFLYQKSTLNMRDQTSIKEVVVLFSKPQEIAKLGQLIDKCSVMWI